MNADMTHHPFQGTPVVSGVAHAPALLVRGEVDPAAIERFGDGGFADADAALAAYDVASEGVSDRFADKAAKASGAAAEVLTASAGLARDKGLRGAVRSPWPAVPRWWPRCTPPSSSSSPCSPAWAA